ARQAEELGLIVLDGAEEGVVVGGAVGGEFAGDEVDVTGGGDGVGVGGVLRREGGIVAVYVGSGGRFDSRVRREVKTDAGLHVEGSAEFDGRFGVSGRIGKADEGEHCGDADGLFRPVDEFRLRDFVFDGEGIFGGVRIGSGNAGDFAAEAVGEGE